MGYGAGIKSIFLKAKEMKSEMIVIVDADGQHDVRDITKIATPIQENKAEIVIGSRFLEKAENIPEYRKFGIKLITKVTNLSLNQSLTDSQSGFRAYSRKVLEKLVLSDKGMGISTEILIKSNNFNFRIGEVPIKVSYEGETSTENPVSHGTSVLFSTIKYTSIEHPIKFYGIPAIILLLSGSVFTYFAIQYYVEFGRLNTNVTLIGAGLFFIGIVLLITAILLYSLVSVVREGRDN